MGGIIRTVLVMSITGSVIAAGLFSLKPLVQHRLPRAMQYYLWLVVIAALLIPVSRFLVLSSGNVEPAMTFAPVNIVDRLIMTPSEGRVFVPTAEQGDEQGAAEQGDGSPALFHAEQPRTSTMQNTDLPMTAPVDITNPAVSGNAVSSDMQGHEYQNTLPENGSGSAVAFAVDIFIFIYPFCVVGIMLYFIISYALFVKLHRRRNVAASDAETMMLAKLCAGRRAPGLFRNPLTPTPMLIGAIRPAIILPDREYTDEQLRAVLLHELTHNRRKDVLVKWLSVIACAVHWFNPAVWLVRREIDRACEMACDEAVIRSMDTQGKQKYGDTLLHIASGNKIPHAVLSTTMCEEKKALKERLGAIMKSKKHTRMAVVLSVVLVLTAVAVVIALGSGRTAAPDGNEGLDNPGVSMPGAAESSDNKETGTPSQSPGLSGLPSLESYTVIERDLQLTEIPLEGEGLIATGPITVDEYGNIYVVNTYLRASNIFNYENEIQKIDGRNEPFTIITGLDNVIGLSAIGRKLYVFEQREHNEMREYYILTYDLNGGLMDNRKIELGTHGNPMFYHASVFQGMPIAILLSVKESIGARDENDTPPYLYNIETGEFTAINMFLEQGYQYYYLNPLPDGRIIASSARYVGGTIAPPIKDYILSVNADMSLTMQEASEVFMEISVAATIDLSTGKTYAMLGGDRQDTEIYIITDKEPATFVISIPYRIRNLHTSGGNYMHIVNRHLYLLFTERSEGIRKIITIGLPDS